MLKAIIRRVQDYNKFLITNKLKVAILVCLLIVPLVIFEMNRDLLLGNDVRVVYSLDRRQNDQEIIRLINNSRKYVYFAIYYFTKREIADALVRAKQRGLLVMGITDRAASQGSNKPVVNQLKEAGISIQTQKHLDGIMHIKAVVTDRGYASGSYNWTEAATESNDEVLEVSANKNIRDQYLNIIKKVLIANQ